MDFVVVGFGLGALILLVGIAARDFAPRLRRPVSTEQQEQGDAEFGIYSINRVPMERWSAACQAAGQAIMIGGGAIILAAAGGIVANLDNGDGAHLVLAVILIVIGGIAVRIGMLANGLFPIDRRSRERVRQSMQRAAPIASVANESPKAALPHAEKAVPVAAVIASNGATSEPIPSKPEVEPAADAASDGESTTESASASAPATHEAPEETPPDGVADDDAESTPPSDAEERTAPSAENGSEEAPSSTDEQTDEQEVDDRAATPVSASVRSNGEQ